MDFKDFFARNSLSPKYLQLVFSKQKNLYLFCLGLSLSVGDVKLILATGVFILAMVSSYHLKMRSLHYYLQYCQKFFKRDEQKLISSIGIAGLVSIVTYFSISVYSELNNSSLAFLLITQTLFSILGIIFFSKKLFSASEHSQPKTVANFEDLIPQLNDQSPVHRLWVINKIIDLWETQQLTLSQVKQLEEYLTLLKNFEFEPVILAKIDHSLKKISDVHSQPLNIPRSNYTSKKHPLPVMQTVNYINNQ
jgi:hypothetical protein